MLCMNSTLHHVLLNLLCVCTYVYKQCWDLAKALAKQCVVPLSLTHTQTLAGKFYAAYKLLVYEVFYANKHLRRSAEAGDPDGKIVQYTHVRRMTLH